MKEREVIQEEPKQQLRVWHWAVWVEKMANILVTLSFLACLSNIVRSMVYPSHHTSTLVAMPFSTRGLNILNENLMIFVGWAIRMTQMLWTSVPYFSGRFARI
jgi:hypothetical protein